MAGQIVLPELELFSRPPTQQSIERDLISEHRSLASLSSSHNIEFVIKTSIDEYIKLAETDLYVKLKVKHTGTGQGDDWTKYGFKNNLLNSLFSNIRVYIGNNEITFNSQNHPYKAMYTTLFGTNDQAKNTHLLAAGFAMDESTAMDSINSVRNKLVSTHGKPNETEGYATIELMGKLFTDLTLQPRAILGGSQLKIELIPNNSKFIIHHHSTIPNTVESTFEFEQATLFVHRAKVTPALCEAHNKTIEKQGVMAIYPHSRIETKHFVINQQATEYSNDAICLGQLPRRMLIGFVATDAFNGDYKKNPFNFKHYKVNHISTYLNGLPFPNKAHTPNFTLKEIVKDYISLYENMNQDGASTNINITLDKFLSGYTLFPINYAADLSEGGSYFGHVNSIKEGVCRILVKFAEPLPENVTMVCTIEYDNTIYIDANRQGYADFNKF